MQRIEELLALQRQKRDLFASLEATTHQLLSCLEEELARVVDEREATMRQIDQISAEIAQQAQEFPEFLDAAANRCPQENLSQPLQEAYATGLEMRAAIGRIKEISLQAEIRMECCRERILEKIKSVNSGAMARASKYHQPMVRQSSFQSEG